VESIDSLEEALAVGHDVDGMFQRRLLRWMQFHVRGRGKISESAVRDVIHGRVVKNTSALANPESLELFKDLPELLD
jgi:hypothetical protein